MKCFKCGTLIDNNAETCSNCGQNLRKIKKEFSPNMYNKIKSISSNKSQKMIPLDISIGDSISEQYIIHEYLNDDLIFYSFIGIDSFNKQKVQIDFVKPALLKTEYDKSQFINSLREEKFRQHENLSIIYDYGKHNSNYYIVSEYIEGISLREIIDTKQENFTLEEIEPIVAQITDALTDIHEDSLVGYLIPENIVIMKNILKIRNTFWFRCFNHKTVLKYFSSDSPSYYYLAPELRGGSPKLINATDLYSIGVILSSLLVGKIYKGVQYNITEYNKNLPYEADPLFLKLVNKNANKRFQNVEDFLIAFDKLFSFNPIDHDQTTRVVNTSDILSIEEENFDFEDEMETSMIDRKHAQNITDKFDDDEHATTVLAKKDSKAGQVFEEDEHETKVLPKKKNKKKKNKNSKKKSSPPPHNLDNNSKKDEVISKVEETKEEEIKEEESKKDSNTSFSSYKNPFYKPEEFTKEQDNFQQQKEFQEYQKSVYQQLSDFQERDNKKNIIMIAGFFAFALIIVVLIVIMFLRPTNTLSPADAKVMATVKKQNEIIARMNKKFEAIEKEKKKSKEEVLLAKKERENKENELVEQKKKIKELESKKTEKSTDEEKKKLEEEKKKAQLEKEKLEKELKAKKELEAEKKEKEEKLRKKLKKEQEALAKKKRDAEKRKAQQTKLIKNKKLSKKLKNDKKKEARKKAEKLAKKKEKERLEKKKKEQLLLAKKRDAEKKKKLEESKKKNDLDAEADALLASAMDENKKEAVVKKEGKCRKGMIKIKEGSFKYGSPASDKSRGPSDPLLKTVNLNTYCIDRYESKGPVNFSQATARCKKRGKRLCSTQEWEKACKGKYNRKYPYGNKFNPDKCNTADEDGEARKYKKTGSLKKCRSPYGLYDMSGNLAEWTKNGNASRQILKGGSYKSEEEDAKCSSVKKASKSSRKVNYGYRCCSDL